MVGARLYYVIFQWENYAEEPITALYVWEGGLAVYGGVIAALIALLCVAKYKKQSFIRVAGFAMPYIILGQAIGRWGNFINAEAYGYETESFMRMYIKGVGEVHPTFLYESLWNTALPVRTVLLQ